MEELRERKRAHKQEKDNINNRWKKLIGLFILLVAYSSLLAWLLDMFEKDEEKERFDNLKHFVQKTMDEFNITQSELYEIMAMSIKDTTLVRNIVNEDDTMDRWSFFGCFKFVLSTMLTIGFGTVTPITSEGLVACVVMALFGIPLAAIVVDGVGENMVGGVVKLTGHRCHGGLGSWAVFGVMGGVGFCVFFLLPAYIITVVEKWSFGISLYYCYICLSTIGFGDFLTASRDFLPDHYQNIIYKLFISIWQLLGVTYFFVVFRYLTFIVRRRLKTENLIIVSRHDIKENTFSSRPTRLSMAFSSLYKDGLDVTMSEDMDSELRENTKTNMKLFSTKCATVTSSKSATYITNSSVKAQTIETPREKASKAEELTKEDVTGSNAKNSTDASRIATPTPEPKRWSRWW